MLCTTSSQGRCRDDSQRRPNVVYRLLFESIPLFSRLAPFISCLSQHQRDGASGERKFSFQWASGGLECLVRDLGEPALLGNVSGQAYNSPVPLSLGPIVMGRCGCGCGRLG
jgi:hypothetical protein